MSETQAASTKTKKPATVYTEVELEDGRKVQFAGNRRMNKDYKIEDGQVHAIFDFVNGNTRTFTLPSNLLLRFAGHGALQKLGDECAGLDDADDMVVAVDSMIERLVTQGEDGWAVRRAAGDSFAGASIVVKALCEATGKSVAEIKTFLDRKLAEYEAAGQDISRKRLYDSFRNPKTKVGQIIARLEQEKASKNVAVNADLLLEELS